VLDAFSNNFRVTVAEEACFDRSEARHAINLCDMQAKYADVLKVEGEVAFHLFDLARGGSDDLTGRRRARGQERRQETGDRGAANVGRVGPKVLADSTVGLMDFGPMGALWSAS